MLKKQLLFSVALMLSLLALTVQIANAQSRNLGKTQTAKCPPGAKCGVTIEPQKTNADRVWEILDIPPQELDIPRELNDGTRIYYSKIVLPLMEAWEIEESDDYDQIHMTRITDSDLVNTFVFGGPDVDVKNSEVFVVRRERKVTGGTALDIQVVCFERRGSISRYRIYNGGKSQEEIKTTKPQVKKSQAKQ